MNTVAIRKRSDRGGRWPIVSVWQSRFVGSDRVDRIGSPPTVPVSTEQHASRTLLNRDGEEVQFLRACSMERHLKNLGPEDAVVLEASCGSFYWARRIEATCATYCVLDANRFRIITDLWNKTDRQDARNLAKALWVFHVTGVFRVSTAYKPSERIRTLRRPVAA